MTPKGNAQEYNANPEGQFIEPEIVVLTEIAKALQGSVPNIVAQTLEANRNAQLQREHEMTQENIVGRNITRNTMNTRNTRNTSNDINSAQSGSNRNTTKVATMREEGSENENNYVNHKRKGCTYRIFSACNLPEFNGKGDAVTTMKWIRETYSVIDPNNCADDEKVKYAAHSFKSEALFWWDMIINVRGVIAIECMTWDEFKEITINKFCPEGELKQLEHEFLNLEQRDMSMREYTTHYNEKARFAKHHVQTEKRRIHRYIWNVPISNSKRKWEGTSGGLKRHDSGMKNKEDRSGKLTCKKCNRMHSGECKAGSTECYKCGKQGHISRECPNSRPCYECGERGHMRLDCLKLKKGTSRNLKLIDGRTDKGGEMPKAKGRAYTMTTNDAMKTSDVVSGTLLINNIYANVLFDSSANRSFMSATFCYYLNKDACILDRAFIVETANDGEVENFEIFEDCLINIDENEFLVRLMPMCLGGFDVVLGMDWLSDNNAEIVCNKKMVRLLSPSGETIYVYGDRKENELGIISMMKASKYIKKGCVAYLAYIIDAQVEKQVVDVPIVEEYLVWKTRRGVEYFTAFDLVYYLFIKT
ncbi:putative reverse transcriptase domain-containing protein [Tanacetum coccineum]